MSAIDLPDRLRVASRRRVRLLAVVASLIVLAAIDLADASDPIFNGGPPEVSVTVVARSIVLGLIALIAVHDGLALLPKADAGSRQAAACAVMVVAWPTLAASALFAVLLAVRPLRFSQLGVEDGTVENLTAVAFITAGVVLVTAAWKVRGTAARVALALLLMGLAGMALGMEEISWGQRLLGLELPSVFPANEQGELNLHNFETNKLEVLFYSGATLGLVILPVLCRLSGWPRGSSAAFVPGPWVVIAAAPAAGMNYDLWISLPIKLSFFLVVVLLARCLIRRRVAELEAPRSAIAAALAVTIAVQVICLVQGDHFLREWDATEYRELLIALPAVGYAVSVGTRTAAKARLSALPGRATES